MPRGGGGAVRKQLVTRLCQAIAADLLSVAGHSRQLHQTPLESRCSRMLQEENSGLRRNHALETLVCPRPGLLNASGLCPQTLLGSSRLGGGAATGHLVTHHQEVEQERRSNQPQGLRAFYPRCFSTVYAVYKEGASRRLYPLLAS